MKEFVLVFVCTGNICRSPMAEGIMKDMVIDEVEKNHMVLPLIVASAGTHAVVGSSASRTAGKVSETHGISLNFHRSKPISESIVRNADLILTMEKNHTDYIKNRWPNSDHVFELKNFIRDEELPPGLTDVMDPIGLDVSVYSSVFDELNKELNRVSAHIFSLVRKKLGTDFS
ncbi:low molecular weight protein arginine phosphatase [Candidatus Latescibacterota bacterium]